MQAQNYYVYENFKFRTKVMKPLLHEVVTSFMRTAMYESFLVYKLYERRVRTTTLDFTILSEMEHIRSIVV